MTQLRQFIREQILAKFIVQGTNVAEYIRAVMNDPSTLEQGGLRMGWH